MTQVLQDLIIGRFISRPDVFAWQSNDGRWAPSRQEQKGIPYEQWPLIPWSREYLQAHLDETMTLGHYMLGTDSTVKLVAFDIDLDESGHCPSRYDDDGVPQDYVNTNLREAWHDRSNPHRTWMKSRLRHLSHSLAACVFTELEIPVAVAYSGNKGVHVYGFFDEPLPASDARLAGELAMKALNQTQSFAFELIRGSFLWKDANPDVENSFSNMTIEIFPKQDEIAEGSFGNLMALPLGRNQKNLEDPKFFVDMRAPMNELVPCDPTWALTTRNPWSDN